MIEVLAMAPPKGLEPEFLLTAAGSVPSDQVEDGFLVDESLPACPSTVDAPRLMLNGSALADWAHARSRAGLVPAGSNPWPWLVSTSCSVTVPHTEVQCSLPEGAGQNLEARLLVAGAWARFQPDDGAAAPATNGSVAVPDTKCSPSTSGQGTVDEGVKALLLSYDAPVLHSVDGTGTQGGSTWGG